MTDSYGDGWSFGSSIDVSAGGVSIANGTVTGPFGSATSGQLTFATGATVILLEPNVRATGVAKKSFPLAVVL